MEALSSRKIAKLRASETIASDRLACSQDELLQMKKEIHTILSRYLILDDTVSEISVIVTHRIKQGVSYVKTIQIK